MASERAPAFLSVKAGDYVLIENIIRCGEKERLKSDWIGQVLSCIGGARKPKSWTLFQVINIDNGEVSIINADNVKFILKSSWQWTKFKKKQFGINR